MKLESLKDLYLEQLRDPLQRRDTERTLQEEEETDERLTELDESHVNQEALVG